MADIRSRAFKKHLALRYVLIGLVAIAVLIFFVLSIQTIQDRNKQKAIQVEEIISQALVQSLELKNNNEEYATDEIFRLTDLAITMLGDDMYDHRPFLMKANILAKRGDIEGAQTLFIKARDHLINRGDDPYLLFVDDELSERKRRRQLSLIELNLKIKYLSEGKVWKDDKEILDLLREEIRNNMIQ